MFYLLALFTACSGTAQNTPDTNNDGVINNDERWLSDCPIESPELRMVDVGDVTLQVACQGKGPTIILLHGFPEFWYSWQKTMNELADSYRLIVPDQRGYNISEKPSEITDYESATLVSDISGVISRVSEEPVVMVGHDWGGPIAWGAAHENPDMVRLMISANGPHPDIMTHLLLTDPEQQEASRYMDWFIQEGTEETLLENDCAMLDSFFAGVLDDDELEVYHEAWLQENAIKSGLNWYRANLSEDGAMISNVTIDVPTLVLWGLADTALLPQQLNGLEEYAPDLQIVTYEGVSHWIEHEIPTEIASEMDAFIQAH